MIGMDNKEDRLALRRLSCSKPTFISFYLYILYVLYLDQILSDLYSIQCSTFFDLIANDPECQTVFICKVLADTSNVHRVFACKEQRHRVFLSAGLS